MITRRELLLSSAAATAGQALAVDRWPQFRGPGSRGVAADNPRLPDSWSATENVAWKTKIPGRGWACPVAWGDKVFLLSAISSGPVENAKMGLYFGGNRPKPPEHEHVWKAFGGDFKTGRYPLGERALSRRPRGRPSH